MNINPKLRIGEKRAQTKLFQLINSTKVLSRFARPRMPQIVKIYIIDTLT
jgi:hypothetical protein